MLKKLLPLLLLFAGFQANATIIDNGTYTTDTDSGLDWLDVTASINRSYDDVSTEFGSGGDFEGWRYANGLEFDQLWFNISGVNLNGSYVREYYDVDESVFSIDSYVAILGYTYGFHYTLDNGDCSDTSSSGVRCDGGGQNYIRGIIADIYSPGTVYFAEALDFDEALTSSRYCCDYTSAHGGRWGTGQSHVYTGSWLVKDTVAVPEPSITALFGLGLVGIGFTRRRRS
jgi:hypothetical protein